MARSDTHRQGTPSRSHDELDRDLNEALKATFPASDPIAVGDPTGPVGPVPPGRPLPGAPRAGASRTPPKKGNRR